MKRKKHILILAAALLCMFLCTGCVGQSAETLYTLPKQPDEYYDLQNAIDQVLGMGAAYSGPLTGSNQQAVQLADLDGDGEDEAIVFVKVSGPKSLKAYIFDKEAEGTYQNTAVIEGDGSAFDAADYVQIDGEPGLEIIVGRQLSEQISQSLGAYAYREGRLVELMTANYAEYTAVDLDGDDCRDIFILRQEADDRTGTAELYRYSGGQMVREPEVSLSTGAKEIKRMVTGYVSDRVPAVFVASTYSQEEIVTDIFAFLDGGFRNISSNAETGLSAQTVRNYNVYAADIDKDGLVELPTPVALPSTNAAEETFWVIDWFNLGVDGQRTTKMTTFHSYQNGWYLELPESWHDRMTVSRTVTELDVHGHVFSKWNGRGIEPEEIFTVYAFTGENRLEQAQAAGCFLLAEKGETAYAASFGDCPWAKELTQNDLQAMFHFIQVDWNSGEI